MAKSKIPNPLDRRHVVEKDLDAAAALAIAEAYLEQGRRVEAIDFLVKADASDQLAALGEQAVESGDVFLLQALSRQTGEEPTRDTWQRVAEHAEAAGKERYKVAALRQLNRTDD